MSPSARTGLALALATATLVLGACSWRATGSSTPASVSKPTSQSVTPTSAPDPDVGPPGETPAHAARRLFPDLLADALSSPGGSGIPKDATCGVPVTVSRDYIGDRPSLVRWTLPNDTRSTSGRMFAAMHHSPMSTTACVVPVTKNGRTITEFDLYFDSDQQWKAHDILTDVVPGGEVYAFEIATDKLRRTLGLAAAVRPVVLLPSGLVFAIGDNNGREAAVFLLSVNKRPGVVGFGGTPPTTDKVLTPSELNQLLQQNAPGQPPQQRFPPGQLD